LEIQGETGAASDQTAVWWNPGGVGSNTALQAGVTQFVLTDVGTSGPDMVVVQVDNHSTITTYTVTELYDIFLCRFYGQVVTTKG
jgi:hypothetical protein